MERIDRQVVRELVEKKTPQVLRDLPEAGKGWKVHYALFTRAAGAEMQRVQGLLVVLNTMEADLGQ
jgi:hypothetical protein